MANHYETSDEYDVAIGLQDALGMKHGEQTPAEWLGWTIEDTGLGEFDILTPEGRSYRVTVETIDDPDPVGDAIQGNEEV